MVHYVKPRPKPSVLSQKKSYGAEIDLFSPGAAVKKVPLQTGKVMMQSFFSLTTFNLAL
jgi:hypothetical protein